jgi:hypothetical protein
LCGGAPSAVIPGGLPLKCPDPAYSYPKTCLLVYILACILVLNLVDLLDDLLVLGFSKTAFLAWAGMGCVYIDTCSTILPCKLITYNFKICLYPDRIRGGVCISVEL